MLKKYIHYSIMVQNVFHLVACSSPHCTEVAYRCGSCAKAALDQRRASKENVMSSGYSMICLRKVSNDVKRQKSPEWTFPLKNGPTNKLWPSTIPRNTGQTVFGTILQQTATKQLSNNAKELPLFHPHLLRMFRCQLPPMPCFAACAQLCRISQADWMLKIWTIKQRTISNNKNDLLKQTKSIQMNYGPWPKKYNDFHIEIGP